MIDRAILRDFIDRAALEKSLRDCGYHATAECMIALPMVLDELAQAERKLERARDAIDEVLAMASVYRRNPSRYAADSMAEPLQDVRELLE